MPKLLLPAIICVCTWVPSPAQTPDWMKEAQPFAKTMQIKLLPAPGIVTPIHPPGLRPSPPSPITAPGPVSVLGPVTIKVFNGYAARNFSNVMLEWEALVNGVIRQKGKIPVLIIAAKQSVPVRLPLRINTGANDEVLLNISYKTKKDEPSVPAGYLLSREQLLLKGGYVNDLTVRPDGELTFKDEAGLFTISSPMMSVNLNKQTGWLQHYEVRGVVLLDDNDSLGLKANFWPASPGKDPAGDTTKQQQIQRWELATKNLRLQLFSTSTGTNFAIVNADYDLPGTFCSLHVRYSVNSKGEMLIEQRMDADTTLADTTNTQPNLPRFGMQWFLLPGFDSISYYGKGPEEAPEVVRLNPSANHPPFGIYKQAAAVTAAAATSATNANSPSLENAPQRAARWWKITDRQGKGLMILGDSALLTMNASHFFNDDPEPHAQTRLTIDYPQPAGEALLPYRSYRYSYKVVPVVQ